MIASVWPGNSPLRQAVCADWLRLPFDAETFDFAVGDGCLTTLAYADGYAQLAASVARCLKPGGIFLIRLFCRPAVAEPLESVFADLRNGRIGNFHVFKWRLAMALQGDDAQRGVRLADIWETYHAHVADAALLAQQTGWPLAEIMTIDAYRGAASSYSYPTADEAMDKLAPYFSHVDLWTGGYELAERCPTLILRRR
jgi:SAM-dependent methyltransferase